MYNIITVIGMHPKSIAFYKITKYRILKCKRMLLGRAYIIQQCVNAYKF